MCTLYSQYLTADNMYIQTIPSTHTHTHKHTAICHGNQSELVIRALFAKANNKSKKNAPIKIKLLQN